MCQIIKGEIIKLKLILRLLSIEYDTVSKKHVKINKYTYNSWNSFCLASVVSIFWPSITELEVVRPNPERPLGTALTVPPSARLVRPPVKLTKPVSAALPSV